MDEMPRRVQLSRAKGWRMPENTVKVTRPGKFGNPFIVGEEVPPNTFWRDGRYFVVETTEMAVLLFRHFVLRTNPEGYTGWHSFGTIAGRHLPELRGKNLACFCRLDQPCHADVLLELANADPALSETAS